MSEEKRARPGRPPKPAGERVQARQITLEPDLWEFAAEYGDGFVSGGIRRALQEAQAKKGKRKAK